MKQKTDKWKEFEQLLKRKMKVIDPNHTYLHGIVYGGLDYPKDGLAIQSVDQDQTTYCASVLDSRLFDPTAAKDNSTTVERFSTTDPEAAEAFLRKYNDVI